MSQTQGGMSDRFPHIYGFFLAFLPQNFSRESVTRLKTLPFIFNSLPVCPFRFCILIIVLNKLVIIILSLPDWLAKLLFSVSFPVRIFSCPLFSTICPD